jgi:hypothetical protein
LVKLCKIRNICITGNKPEDENRPGRKKQKTTGGTTNAESFELKQIVAP